MNSTKCLLSWFFAFLMLCSLMNAQQTSSSTASAAVPRLVNFSGKAIDAQGKTISGIAGVTFAIYKDQYEGSPLWLETQNVQADARGNYTTHLGATKPDGLPMELFSSGEARWLGETVNGGSEQPRTVLLSVPYALKAADAETLGGRPFSAFQLVAPQSNNGSTKTAPLAGDQANEIICSSRTACNTSFIPQFSSTGGSAKVNNSIISQSGMAINIAGSETVTSTASSAAILGKSSGTNAVSDGVDGVTSSSSASGVAGINNSGGIGVYGTGGTGVFGTGIFGVYGNSTGTSQFSGGGYFIGTTNGVVGGGNGDATGVTGSVGPISQDSQGINHFQPTGVLGDSGSTGGIAVLGTEDAGYGIVGWTGGQFGYPTAYFHQDQSPTPSAPVLQTYSTVFGGSCTIDATGNLSCTGSKSAVVPVDNGSRKVALYAIEGPENWFEDLGGGQLVNGSAVVHLEVTFAQTVNTGVDYRVFLTPNGDCRGLYVTNKTANSFEVRELGGGSSGTSFDFRIIAKRKGYEDIRLADRTKQFEIPKLARRLASSAPASRKSASTKPSGDPLAELTNK